MRIFRIARSAHIDDMSGAGSRINGGRWNNRGTSVVYASESRALATAEYLVHVPKALVPKDLSIATIQIADNISIETVDPSALPSNWRS